MNTRIKQVLGNVLSVSESEITDESSYENIITWDSFSHIQLIIALQEEFGIDFSDDEIVEMLNFASIKKCIEEKIKNA